MWFLYTLSFVSIFIHMVLATIAVAAALYYLSEIVEEYTSIAKKCIRWMIITSITLYIGFIFFEQIPWSVIICGLCAQLAHCFILATFPYVRLSSLSFISTVVLFLVNHYLGFTYFTSVPHTFTEVLGYFTLCVWLVPFALFISLSANDNVLPTTGENTSLLHGNDIVTNYFSTKGQKPGLLSFFNYAKDSILPQRNKKSF